MINSSFNSWVDNFWRYFPKWGSIGRNMKDESDLPNYTTPKI